MQILLAVKVHAAKFNAKWELIFLNFAKTFPLSQLINASKYLELIKIEQFKRSEIKTNILSNVWCHVYLNLFQSSRPLELISFSKPD